MRLTRLEIFGFKSFATKVTIPFGKGTTAIVGPNGCGKSNVVEAIRWVLGEQRAGAFRSSRMEDVIFAGTRNRKQLSMSDVSLTIENTNNVLPIEYSEVTITRRLFRSGESDYLINKVPCRLLDIQNLLMDTGLGPGAYSVMEQGMVDEIISEKTENRRRILEEAAGITKYKARRRSTWNRLESVQQDLTQLEVRISEIKRTVDGLGRQVSRARRYQELQQELQSLDVLLARHQFFALGAERSPLEIRLKELGTSQESGLTEFTAREADLEGSRLAVVEAEKAHAEVSQELNRCVDEIHAKERQMIAAREQLKAREQFIERGAAQLQGDSAQLEENRRQQTAAAQQLDDARRQLAETARDLSAREEDSAETERLFESSRAELEAGRRQRLDLMRRQADCSRALERFGAERDGLKERGQRLGEEILQTETEHDQAQSAAAAADQSLKKLADTHQRLVQIHERAQQTLQGTRQDSLTMARRRDEARRAVEANQARLQVMEQVRAGYQGYSSGVRALMLDSPHKDLFAGVVGDLVEVEDPAYRRAVETALGEGLEALVATDDEGLREVMAYLHRNGQRAGIFPLSWHAATPLPPSPPVSVPGLLGPLADFIRAEATVAPLLNRLLADTYLVEDLPAALGYAAEHLDRRLRFITPEGDAIDLFGRVSAGHSTSEDASVLGRRTEIRRMRRVIAQQKAHYAILDASAGHLERRLAVLGDRTENLTGRLQLQREQQREQAHTLQAAQADAKRSGARLGTLQADRRQLDTRLEELAEQLTDNQNRLAAFDKESAQLEATIAANEERLSQVEELRRDKQEQLNALRVERATVAEKVSSLDRDLQRLKHLEQGLQSNIARLESELEQAAGQRESLEDQDRQISAALTQMHERRQGLDEQRNQRYTLWQEVNAATRAIEEEIGRMQRALTTQREERHQLELRVSELKTQGSQIQQRLLDDYECDIEGMGPLDEDAEFNADQTQDRLAQLRRAIHNLGPVHVGVLQEYEQEKERFDFYIHHRDDLLQAAEDLKKTLNRIDTRARRIFNDTFEAIRTRFRETFVRFFPGGEADLVLEAGADPLEARIDISARPRGKRLQSISLLSGGERALTAVALLFAIYQVKPSPFCILDEVDAPLDDTNVERFVRVLREFARNTQFVMVTHNKISMGAGDTLHGVTMPEEGVSQLVSVQMGQEDQFLDEAAG